MYRHSNLGLAGVMKVGGAVLLESATSPVFGLARS